MPETEPSDASVEFPGPALREQALTIEPAELGLGLVETGPVWGFVMDSAFADSANWFSLVTFAEGTTSLYTNAAFGIIGGGTHPQVRAASEQLLRVVSGQIDSFAADSDTSLPAGGMVTMRALTFRGPKTITAPEADLVSGTHPAAAVFVAAHAVITALRVAGGEIL